MKSKLSLLAIALAGVFPLAQTAHAQTTAELKQEIELLKKQLQVLMQKVDAASAAAPAATAAGMNCSPLTVSPSNAPNTLPGATLRLSMANPVTSIDSPPAIARPA